mgnify:CR=1 FL=1
MYLLFQANVVSYGMRIRCIFRPEAWVQVHGRKEAIFPVEPLGETTWDMEVNALPKSNSYSSDDLRNDPAAPQWVKDWSGPFEVDFYELD